MTGRRETEHMGTGRTEMGGKTTGEKETGVGETRDESDGDGSEGDGRKVSGGKATGAHVSQETRGNHDMLMCEREIDNSRPGDKAAV